MATRQLLVLIILVIVLGGLGYGYYHATKTQQMSISLAPTPPARINSIAVQNGEFVVHGEELQSVTVWGVPTGTGVTPDSYIRLADLHEASSTGLGQTWVGATPPNAQLLTHVFARGTGSGGATTSDVYLSVTGATALHALLQAHAPMTIQAGQTGVILGVGASGTLMGHTITLNRINEDSRCPDGVACIQAGTVKAAVIVSDASGQATSTILSLRTPKQVFSMELTMTDVTPAAQQNRSIAPGDYTVSIAAAPIQ